MQPTAATMELSTEPNPPGKFLHQSTAGKEKFMEQERHDNTSQSGTDAPGRRRFWKRAGIAALLGAR